MSPTCATFDVRSLSDHAGDDEQELMLGQRGTGVTTVEAPVESDDRWGRGGLLRRDDTQQDGGRQQSSQRGVGGMGMGAGEDGRSSPPLPDAPFTVAIPVAVAVDTPPSRVYLAVEDDDGVVDSEEGGWGGGSDGRGEAVIGIGEGD